MVCCLLLPCHAAGAVPAADEAAGGRMPRCAAAAGPVSPSADPSCAWDSASVWTPRRGRSPGTGRAIQSHSVLGRVRPSSACCACSRAARAAQAAERGGRARVGRSAGGAVPAAHLVTALFARFSPTGLPLAPFWTQHGLLASVPFSCRSLLCIRLARALPVSVRGSQTCIHAHACATTASDQGAWPGAGGCQTKKGTKRLVTACVYSGQETG